MLAWANLHGAFVAGFVIWEFIGHALCSSILFRSSIHRKQESVEIIQPGGGLALVATLINRGWRLWETSLGFCGMNTW
jgi:hypothetical protein